MKPIVAPTARPVRRRRQRHGLTLVGRAQLADLLLGEARRNARGIVCSAAWVDEILTRIEDGDASARFEFAALYAELARKGIYPPRDIPPHGQDERRHARG